ncbi:MAG TPA: DUF6529 family protein [Ktedonobacterales bacterium]|jgi:hypothetical protein
MSSTSETLTVERRRPPNPAWLAIPLVLFALISLTVGLVASRTIPQPYPTPFFHAFFSDTLHMKVWLASVALLLGCFQLLTAARIYELLRFPPPGRFYHIVHRWSGRVAILITLPVAYHCIFLLGFGTYDWRVYLHSILGSMIYGAVVAKVLLVRSSRYPGWALPIAGGALFAILLGIWLTSAAWFFSTYPLSL